MSQKNTVLVVEDNDFVRMQIVNFLKDASYTIVEASGGEDALDIMVSNADIGLAIVDVRMEPVGGFAFIKALRGRNMTTPVILVTGDQTPDLLEQAGKVGVAAVLMKPVNKDRLIKTVTKTIENARRAE
jgi:DNA-binding NtrC family response regulator